MLCFRNKEIKLELSQRRNFRYLTHTEKPVLKGNSKIDTTTVLKTNGSLIKVESIAECSLGAFCNTFGLALSDKWF